MSTFTNKPTHFLEDDLNADPEFSYINMLQEDYSKYKKASHLNVNSNIRGVSKSRDKNITRKSKDHNPVSRSISRKKSRTYERSQSKTKKTPKKISSKIVTNAKK